MKKLHPKTVEHLIGGALALFALFLYIKTLCPTLNFIDAGELATVAYTLGIAHPTGYPLYSILGWVFSHLPLGFRPIYQINLMAAVLCAVGVYFFFRFLVFFTNDFIGTAVGKEKKLAPAANGESLVMRYAPAAFGALVLAFSETYWSQALSIEVYPLHIVFLALLLLLFTRASFVHLQAGNSLKGDDSREERLWWVFALVLGLAFTNHMTTILLAPAFLFFFFYLHRFTTGTWRRLVRMAIPFLLGFSVQLYLPIRASEHPIMNWGNPDTFERWLWHFSGKVYRVWIFSSTESAAKQLKYFFNMIGDEFAYFPLAFALIGIIALVKEKRMVFYFTVLLFLGCLFYSINYDIHDIDSYFLLAYFTIAAWSAIGVKKFLSRIKGEKQAVWAGLLVVFSTGFIISYNYPQVDESDNQIVEQYTRDMFRSLEPNAIIISYQWDYFVSAAYYLQVVEHVRPDVVVIDKELMRRTWYYKQLEGRYPWLIAQSKRELDAFLVELDKFDHGRPYDPSLIEYRYTALIQSFVRKNLPRRPVYATQEIESQYLGGIQRVPSGLAFRLYGDTLRHEMPILDFNPSLPARRDTYVEGIAAQYAQSELNNGIYAYVSGRQQEALRLIDKSLALRPTDETALAWKEKLGVPNRSAGQ